MATSLTCVLLGTKPCVRLPVSLWSWIHVLQHLHGSYLKPSGTSVLAPDSKAALWRTILRSNPTLGIHESLPG